MNDIHFKIIVPMYNVEKWVRKNIESVKQQNYANFECIIIDDISEDKSVEIVRDLIDSDERFKLVVNKNKKYALQNIYEGIELSNPADHDVIITLDGDDWLHGIDVFEKLNDIYKAEDCYLTYGEFANSSNLRSGIIVPNGAAHPFPPLVIKNNCFRSYTWMSSHLRTFKYGLWKNIKKEDLLDQSGQFYRMAWDVAFMMPMLEMAASRQYCVPEVIYIYNNENPINDSKVDPTLQLSLDREIRSKSPYSPLPPF
jgi:glycosyltransferase involved in cell wall biosynthesis